MDKLFGILISILVGAVAGLLFSAWIACGFGITTDAMTPKLKTGDTVFINRSSKEIPERGTLMLIKVPGGEAQIVRRLIALPGEEIKIESGVLFINGQIMSENYLTPDNVAKGELLPPQIFFGPIIVEEGGLFFLADDRTQTLDSREFGSVKKSDLLGKVWTLFGQPVVL